MTDAEREAEDVLCRVLRGEVSAWSARPDLQPLAARSARIHGVEALVYERLADAGAPPELRQRALAHATWELRHQQLLRAALAGLERQGVRPILIKGSALAYSVYPRAVLRTRGDSDLIVPIADRQRARDILVALGWSPVLGMSGEFVSYQLTLQRQCEGETHALDLHWKINNSELLSNLFAYEELRAPAQALPALGPAGRGACNVHAMLIACMHRLTHLRHPYYVDGDAHYLPGRLIWLYDIHLLASLLDAEHWEQLLTLARAKELLSVTLEGLSHARERFGTPLPPDVEARLGDRLPTEAPAAYFAAPHWRQHWADLRALGSLRRRTQFLRETLFPPADYMRRRYPQWSSGWLPWLYLRRMAGGLGQRLRRHSP